MTTEKPKQARALIGQVIRGLRIRRHLTLEQLATKTGITYQYLSGLENGRENFSIGVLESLCNTLSVTLDKTVQAAYSNRSDQQAPITEKQYFRESVPLPGVLTIASLQSAMDRTQEVFWLINRNMLAEVGRPLHELVQGNSFSGLVSNVFSDAMDQFTCFKHNDHQRYPDLVCEQTGEGLEVKATIQVRKGGESHNGHSGWHTVACFAITKTGIEFLHLMFAHLVGHQHPDTDWKYVGSKVNTETGSRRTETYNTNLQGTTKLRDGSIFLNTEKVSFKRWRQKRSGSIPEFSIFLQ